MSDCSTIVGEIASSVLCRAQTLSSFDLNQISGYSTLPACATSIISYGLLSFPECIAGAVGGLPHTNAYPICLCSTNFAVVTSMIGGEISEECSSASLPSASWTSIAEAYCSQAAGGFIAIPQATPTLISSSKPTGASAAKRSITTTGASITGLTKIATTSNLSSTFSAGGSTEPFTTSSASPTSSTFPPAHSRSLSAGAIAGIAIGVAIAVITALLVCAVFAFGYSARKKSEKKPEESERPPTDYEMHRFFNRFNIQRDAWHNRRA
ncbi:hypothetical protein AOQ84DRAFT_364645 [Glonium stellatum]|uniref:Extracellular membrane protein CFEM domain-containing protein n=1 Tax=Glonium stellatum TaxID=574774 RepID=A0A8E2EZM5_9PEZI|nr:hypothetical protein AOQ84DRAFT_364645 [Glonium stellatum]